MLVTWMTCQYVHRVYVRKCCGTVAIKWFVLFNDRVSPLHINKCPLEIPHSSHCKRLISKYHISMADNLFCIASFNFTDKFRKRMVSFFGWNSLLMSYN